MWQWSWTVSMKITSSRCLFSEKYNKCQANKCINVTPKWEGASFHVKHRRVSENVRPSYHFVKKKLPAHSSLPRWRGTLGVGLFISQLSLCPFPRSLRSLQGDLQPWATLESCGLRLSPSDSTSHCRHMYGAIAALSPPDCMEAHRRQ